jgi:hypothetical protein
MMQLRIRRLYDEIRFIEREMKEGTEIDASVLNAKLDLIDQRANLLQLPNVYASSLYTLRSHIDLVRTRLAAMTVADKGRFAARSSSSAGIDDRRRDVITSG